MRQFAHLKMKMLVAFLIIACCALQVSAGTAAFRKVNSRVALANEEMAARMKDQLLPSATKVWEPKPDQVLNVLLFLETEKGKNDVMTAAHTGTNMQLCISKITETRFQVYGFVINNRKCLLFDSAPDVSTPQAGLPDRWLEESVGQHVYDGGADFWFVVYDLDDRRTIASGRRPD